MAKPSIPPGTQFENAVRYSLKKIGFKHVAGGGDFRVGSYQVDACGGWDDTLLVFECTQSNRENATIHKRIPELRGESGELRRAFKHLPDYLHYSRFVFCIVTNNIGFTKGDHEIAAQKPEIHLIDFKQLQYYQDLAELIGRGALFNFLGELGVVELVP